MNNYVKTLIQRMANVSGTVLTDDHYKILEFSFEYYQKHKVAPLYYNYKKYLGFTKSDISRLFPYGLYSVYRWVDIPIHTTDHPCQPVPNITVKDYNQVYLDYNATTFIRDTVSKVLVDYYSGNMGYGNPSSSTDAGKVAYELVQNARYQLADLLKVKTSEVFFTGSGSEANNLAIKGLAFKYPEKNAHFITDKTEHSSVLNTFKYLESLGYSVTWLDVNNQGLVSADDVKAYIKPETVLVSIMAVNNEIGTINPIKEIGAVCKQAQVPLHVDAIQAFGRIHIHPKEFGISLMSLSSHKIYGPKGIGALFIDNNIKLDPLIHGGNQEFGMRSGTENVGHIIAFGKAASLAVSGMESENERLTLLRDYFLEKLVKIAPGIVINGSINNRVPHNLSIGFPGIQSGALLLSLNQIGVYVSSGSACSQGSSDVSHVLKAIKADTNNFGSIRFGFGLKTTIEDLNYVLKYLPDILSKQSSLNNV